MKQKLLKMTLLLCALIAGSSVWADTKELTFNMSSNPGEWPTANSTTLTGYTYTLNEVNYTFALKNVKCNSGYLMLTATAALGLPAIDGYKLTKVEATNSGGCSTSTKVGISSSSSEAKYVSGGGIQTWATTSTKYTYNLTETSVNTMYYMYVTNKNAQVVSLTLTYETDVMENEVTFSYVDYQGWANSPDYGKEITMSKTDVDITNNWFYTPQGYSYIQFTATNGTGTITITPKNDATITKVEFIVSADYNGYQNSQTIIPSTGTVSKNEEGTIVTWTGSANATFTLKYNSHIHWTSIIVTYTGGLPVCATPFISGNTPFSTSTTVTITCATEGASITYCTSTDGVNFSSYVPYAAPFPLSETTIVKAKATKEGMVDSQEASKTFTQLVTPNIAGIASSGASDQFVRLTNALVTYKNGNYTYLEDASGAILLYCSNDLAAGDKLNGYMHVTDYTVYNGLPEVKAFTLEDGYTKTTGNTVTPTVVTIAQLMDDPESSPYEMYLSKYVKIENATVTSAFAGKESTIEQGGYTIVLRDNGTSTLTSKVGDFVTVTGHVSIYKKDETKKQIAVFEQSQIVVSEAPAVPTITVTPSSLTGLTYVVDNGPSAAQTITVSGTNLTADITLTLNNSDYEMSPIETDGYVSSLTLPQSAGSVAETTIYVRLKEGLAVNASYNGSIAIASTDAATKSVTLSGSVTEPSADYAILPFEYDGNCTGELPAGLTQEGLGTKTYASSPKIGFDTTGDYIILKINERPGTLSFDIKGNSFSGGTFTVQTSEDGETYTDLKNYTELGATQSEEFTNLGENVRYIKWIYTEKSSGNVALGNIKLAKFETPSPSITVSSNSIVATAAETDGTITVTYNNITNVLAEVNFFMADGTTPATYDWLDAEINSSDNTKLDYVIGANTGEARTAYMKVYAVGDEGGVYSGLITITQAAPVSGDQFALFTGDLVEGDYIIYYNGKAMNTTVTNNRLQYEEVTPEGNTITTDDSAIVWHIAKSGDYWTIYNAEANAYAAANGTRNQAQMLADGTDDMALWTNTGSETYEFVNKHNAAIETNANLRNNGTYGFACYGTNTGSALTLYKKVLPVTSTSLTLNAYGFATFASTKALDFTGYATANYSAWQITSVNTSTGVITFEQIKQTVAPGTGLLLKGTPSETITLNIQPEGGTTLSSNLLEGFPNGATINADEYYGLSGNKFVKVNGGTIPAGKALLPASEVSASVKAFTFVFEDDSDGINSLTPDFSEGEGAIYNLAGQRIDNSQFTIHNSQLKRGIYIVNGKKILK